MSFPSDLADQTHQVQLSPSSLIGHLSSFRPVGSHCSARLKGDKLIRTLTRMNHVETWAAFSYQTQPYIILA